MPKEYFQQPVTFDEQYGRHVRLFWDIPQEPTLPNEPPYGDVVMYIPDTPSRPYDWEIDGE